MRMRKKKWAMPELEACPWAIPEDCDRFRGRWRALFPKDQPLRVELGCGKGVSTSEMAWAEKDVNFIAIDVNSDVLAVARRNIAARYGDTPVGNIRLAIKECAYTEKTFAPADGIDRVTHPRQLMQYRAFLADEGEIWFKTDDDDLFADSLAYFAECGFTIRYITYDLHASGFSPNYVSEHEKMFTAEGKKTKFLIAVKDTLETPPDLTRRK